MMSKAWLFIVAGLVALLVISMIFGNQIAAGAGAALLIGTIIYVTLAQRRDPSNIARAERGAKELREELDAKDNP
jgi:hypothetical protein